MENARRAKYLSCTDGLYRSRLVPFASLVLIVSRILSLIRLFGDAADRANAGQAAPEHYTLTFIAFEIGLIALLVLLFFTVRRFQRRRSRLPRKLLRAELNALSFLWSAVFVVRLASDMIAHSEIVYLVDLSALLAAFAVPNALLFLSDCKHELPNETALSVCGVAGTALSAFACLVFAVFDRKSYSTFSRLMPELLFRAGLLVYGIAVLLVSIRLKRRLLSAFPDAKPPKKKRAKQEEDDDDYGDLTEEEIAEVEAYRRELVRRKQAGESDWLAGFERETEAPAPDEPASDAPAEPTAPPAAEAPTPVFEPDPEPFPAEPAPMREKGRSPRPAPETDTRHSPEAPPSEEDALQALALRRLRESGGTHGRNLVRSVYDASDIYDNDRGNDRDDADRVPSSRRRKAGSIYRDEKRRAYEGQKALTEWKNRRMHRENEFEEQPWERRMTSRPAILDAYDSETVKRITCPNCGKRVPEDFPFCPRCGIYLTR